MVLGGFYSPRSRAYLPASAARYPLRRAVVYRQAPVVVYTSNNNSDNSTTNNTTNNNNNNNLELGLYIQPPCCTTVTGIAFSKPHRFFQRTKHATWYREVQGLWLLLLLLLLLVVVAVLVVVVCLFVCLFVCLLALLLMLLLLLIL